MQPETLLTVMRQQRELYDKLIVIEERKSAVITDRNPSELQKLVKEQEEIVNEIDLLESKRGSVVRYLSLIYGFKTEQATVSELISHLDRATAESLNGISAELKKSMNSLALRIQTNSKLMNDNIEIFKLMIDSIRDSLSDGIGYPGMKEKNGKTAVLINRTA